MSDTYTKVTHTSWLGNIMNSVVGAAFGVLLFLLAFVVIWFAEGRTNMAEVAAKSVAVSAAAPAPANEGQLVAVSGTVEAEPLGDAGYLREGGYLRLERVVEMYAWVEDERTERQDNVGGSSTERTTYTYTKRWTRSPESGDSFAQPSGHRNPPLEFEEAMLSAEGGRIGGFAVDLGAIDLPGLSDLALSEAVVAREARSRLAGDYLFFGNGTPSGPELGDVRISYRALPAGGQVTAFAQQSGDTLVAFRTEKGDVLFRALEGSREAAIEQLQVEDTTMDWILRIGSLLMLWVGLMLMFGPINAVLGVLPALKQAGGCLFSVIAFVPAFVLWAVAEAVAIILNNPWLMLAAIVIALGAGVFFARRWKPGPRTAAVGG